MDQIKQQATNVSEAPEFYPYIKLVSAAFPKKIFSEQKLSFDFKETYQAVKRYFLT